MAEMISRKEIKKTDEFLHLGNNVVHFLSENRKMVFRIIGFILLLGIALVVYDYYSKKSSEESFAAYFKAKTILQEKVDKVKTWDANSIRELTPEIDGMKRVIQKYTSSQAAALGLFEIGELYFKAKNYDEAISNYSKCIENTSNELIKLQALISLGYAYEAKNYFSHAVEFMKKALAFDKAKYFKADNLLTLALFYEKMNNKEEAKKTYREILRDYPKTPEAIKSERFIKQLP